MSVTGVVLHLIKGVLEQVQTANPDSLVIAKLDLTLPNAEVELVDQEAVALFVDFAPAGLNLALEVEEFPVDQHWALTLR